MKEEKEFENWKRNALLFLTSQAISLFGSSLVQYAIIWYITLSTKSGFMMTISTLCGFIPQILISLFAGVWADRHNKKKMIIIADLSIAFSTLIVAIIFLLGIKDMWLLFVVLIIRSFGSGIQSPTVNAFIPDIIPQQSLMKINGVNSTVQSITLILSPIASGALLGNIDLGLLLFIDVITAIIGVSLFQFVKIKYKKKSQEKIDYFISIKDGIGYVKKNKLIARLINYNVLLSFVIAPLALLTPLMVARSFGEEPWRLTLNEISFFIGSILGGIIISTWGGFKNKIHTIILACFLCGSFSVLMGLSFHFAMFLIAVGLSGITMPMFNTPFLVIFQERVELEMQGRIFSLIQIVGSSTMPLAMVLYGPLADYMKIEYILIIAGLFMTILSFFFLKDKVIKENYSA